MKFSWERLAEHLRTELGERGNLIRLLELQRELKRDAAEQRRLEIEVGVQADEVRLSRDQREKKFHDFLDANSLPRQATAHQLLEKVTPDARPLIQALNEEIERLDERLRRLTRRLPAATQKKLRQVVKL